MLFGGNGDVCHVQFCPAGKSAPGLELVALAYPVRYPQLRDLPAGPTALGISCRAHKLGGFLQKTGRNRERYDGVGDVDEEARLAGGRALRSYPKDPSELVGEDLASARGHFGPPGLRTQGDCLSKHPQLFTPALTWLSCHLRTGNLEMPVPLPALTWPVVHFR